MRLRAQLIIYFLLLLVLKSMLIIGAIGYLMSEHSYEFYRERGIHLTYSMMTESALLVYHEDISALSGFIQNKMNDFPDLKYIIIMNMKGDPLYSSFPKGIPKSLMEVVHSDTKNNEVTSVLIRDKNEMIYDYEGNKANVRLRLGMSLSPIQHLIREVITYLLWISVGGIIGILFIAWYISRPVEELHKAMERALSVGKDTGDDKTFHEIREISELATDFHLLMNQLEDRTRQLDASRKQVYLGEIASNISHEINNPLGVMVMNSEFLLDRAKKGELSEAAAKEVSRIHTMTNKVSLIVQKFLQFARYNMKGEEIKYHRVNLNTLIDETVNLLQDKFQLLGCKIRLDFPAELPDIYCDEQGLQQVLFNLLTNALDASPEGAEIVIHIFSVDKNVVIKVSDTGSGMSEDVKKKAFDPFFTTKEIGKGTGLGLAISSAIVKSHGGNISIENNQGKGTTIIVTLPMKNNNP